MNETVINLAIQTVALLKSSVQEDFGMPDTGKVSQYFEKLGVNSAVIIQEYGRFGKLYLQSKLQADRQIAGRALYDDLCREINAVLRFHEKVYLLLMVQDCLISSKEQAVSEILNHVFNGIGIDSSLIERLKDFLEQDDPSLVNKSEYLLLAPVDASQDEILEGRWIENNAPRQKENYSIFQAEGFTSHILVMFVDQIKSYVVRCLTRNDEFF